MLIGRDLACGMQREDQRGDWGEGRGRHGRCEAGAGRAALEREGRCLAVPRELVKRFCPADLLRLE